MQAKKSSRKLSILTAILILAAGIFIGGYLVLKSNKGTAGELDKILKGNFNSTTCNPDSKNPNLDSDNDGLKDWQETQSYHTDPCKPDSDGDGYFDGEEVASGYDPAKKAPGDELPGTTSKTPRPLPENLTKALSLKLKEQITQNQIRAVNAQGGVLSTSELQNYPSIQQTVKEIMAGQDSLFAPEKIDENQIKTTSNNNRAAIQTYAAVAANSLAYNPNSKIQTSQSEPESFQKAMQTKDFSELDFQLQNYQNSYEKLKKIIVPTDLLPLHIEQLNLISSLIKIYPAIEEIETDPLKTNLALQQYEITLNRYITWMQKLSDFLETHK